jgi:hypothetical protein
LEALPTSGSTLPFADFCDVVKVNRFPFSHESVTRRRSPEVSLTAFDAQPPDLQPVPLMGMDFAVVCPLVRHRMPQIRFLYIGSRLCSALLSGPASRRVLFHPCASLSLHVHHVVKRTFTSKRSNMLGTQPPPSRLRRRGPKQSPGRFQTHPPSRSLLCPLTVSRYHLPLRLTGVPLRRACSRPRCATLASGLAHPQARCSAQVARNNR